MATHNCKLTIDNTANDQELTLESSTEVHGSFDNDPASVPANTISTFSISANAGIYGAEGKMTFSCDSGNTEISLTFGDPVHADNYVTLGISGDDSGDISALSYFYANADAGQNIYNGVQESGNPVVATFKIIRSC